MNNDRQRIGQAATLVTILIWGTTFISTKVLLDTLSPVEILFLRFSLGYLALWLAAPRRLRLTDRRQEGLFALAGLCGVTSVSYTHLTFYPLEIEKQNMDL